MAATRSPCVMRHSGRRETRRQPYLPPDQRARVGPRASSGAWALDRIPTVTALQSLADATVVAADLGAPLFERLPARRHELVVFDMNRTAWLSSLVPPESKH